MNKVIINYDEVTEPVPEVTPEAAAPEGETSAEETPEVVPEAETDPDYTQLLYEYVSNRDVMSGTRQEEIHAIYLEKITAMEKQLQEIYYVQSWSMALMVVLIVLILFKSVRRWIHVMMGGNSKNVY